MKPTSILAFHVAQTPENRAICDVLRAEIDRGLPEADSKIWHAHPVWFLEGNPIAGYSKLKNCVRLMFWSGADFEEPDLQPGTGKYKDASVQYTSAEEINIDALQRWLSKARDIQWDYKNIYKRKGQLLRLR